MSEKRNVPTFQIITQLQKDAFEGPIVSPNKQHVANDFPEVHEILNSQSALLVYDKQWLYLPLHSIIAIRKGKNRFSLPWPLVKSVDVPSL